MSGKFEVLGAETGDFDVQMLEMYKICIPIAIGSADVQMRIYG